MSKPDDEPALAIRVYEKAQQHILEMIEGPDYAAGDRIPSERELSERFGISRMTMRKAIDRLALKGLIERRGTSGTYIPVPVIKRPLISRMFSQGISQIVRDCVGHLSYALHQSLHAVQHVVDRRGQLVELVATAGQTHTLGEVASRDRCRSGRDIRECATEHAAHNQRTDRCHRKHDQQRP